MQVQVNGKSVALKPEATVSQLIAQLEMGEKRMAVEVNKELVVKSEWPNFVLKDEDKIEIVSFVGGG